MSEQLCAHKEVEQDGPCAVVVRANAPFRQESPKACGHFRVDHHGDRECAMCVATDYQPDASHAFRPRVLRVCGAPLIYSVSNGAWVQEHDAARGPERHNALVGHRCEECGGEGRQYAVVAPGDEHVLSRRCPSCGGFGVVADEVKRT